MGILGKQAPDFSADAVQAGKIIHNFTLNQFKDKNVLLFFYPLDFTFVCPTELHAFQDDILEFEKRNTQVIGCSVDSVYSHLAWLNTPKNKGGIEGVSYPLIGDINKTVARHYDVLDEKAGISYRGLFLIDRLGVVRHQMINDLALGRSVKEVLRVIDALCFHEEYGEVCPANWQVGKKGMRPTEEGLHTFFNSAV